MNETDPMNETASRFQALKVRHGCPLPLQEGCWVGRKITAAGRR